MENNIKYFLAQDNSSHHCLVEAKYRGDWEKWLELDEDDPSSWTLPGFAKLIGGSPSSVEFYLE